MANFNFNKVILVGRLVADPELKQTPQGTSVVSFSIAVKRKGKEAVTDFINCVAWRDTAQFVSMYFKKASCIAVSGSIQVRNWTDTNNFKHYATEVIVDEAYFVDSKSDNASASVSVPEQPPVLDSKENPKFDELPSDDDILF